MLGGLHLTRVRPILEDLCALAAMRSSDVGAILPDRKNYTKYARFMSLGVLGCISSQYLRRDPSAKGPTALAQGRERPQRLGLR